MQKLHTRAAVGVAVALAFSAPGAFAAISGVSEVVFFDGEVPLVATHAPGDRDHLIVGLRSGRVEVVDLTTGQAAAQPLVTVPGVDTMTEGGLLGVAFHPDFQSNGKFYVHATLDPGDANPGFFDPFVSSVLEYTVPAATPYVADPTPRVILEVPQPFANHNGGWIGFNPVASPSEASQLYVAIGDGGIEGPDNPGQDVEGNLLGNLLRIDVDGDDFPADPNRNYAIPSDNPFVGVAGEDEVFAYGLRNPYRASFDRQTGDLWIGDVGDAEREEINVIRAGDAPGKNFGWDACEGLVASAACSALGAAVTDPVYDYSHPGSIDPGYSPPEFRGRSVTGGRVYRGPDPDLQGLYLFGDVFPDFGSGGEAFWSLDADDPVGSVERLEDDLFPGEQTNFLGGPVSFGEDAVGNVYILTFFGVYRVETDALVAGDFNADGVVDAADYTVWRDTLRDAPSYATWSAAYGATAQDGPAGAATPEPSAALLVALVGAVALVRRRRAADHETLAT